VVARRTSAELEPGSEKDAEAKARSKAASASVGVEAGLKRARAEEVEPPSTELLRLQTRQEALTHEIARQQAAAANDGVVNVVHLLEDPRYEIYHLLAELAMVRKENEDQRVRDSSVSALVVKLNAKQSDL
jgi:hypothetical protein